MSRTPVSGRAAGSRPERTLLLVNAAGALAATGFATLGLLRPDSAVFGTGRRLGPASYWAASSAFRTCAVTLPTLVAIGRRRAPSEDLLLAAGVVQLGDAVLGLRLRNVGMSVAPAVMGLVHLATARAVKRSRTASMASEAGPPPV